MSDETKKLVLARRARFLAAAMTGAAAAGCGKEKAEPPQPCLSVVYQPPDAEAPPAPCLTVAPPSPPVPDAGDAGRKR